MSVQPVYASTLPTDALLDTGVLYINSSTPYGVTRGGLSFDPGKTTENLDFDGKFADIEGLDRVIGWKPIISGTIIALNAVKMGQLEPGSTTTGTTDKTITPKAAGDLYATADYLTNVRVAYRRAGGGFAIVKFAVARVNKWSAKGGSGTAGSEVAIEIEAVLDATTAATNPAACPYEIDFAAAV